MDLSRDLPLHMRGFGIRMLGSGVVGVTFSEMMNDLRHTTSIVQVALAAEVLVKARIAETDVALIFDPPLDAEQQRSADVLDLLYNLRTVRYSGLPNLLSRVSGYELDADKFRSFGNLRNALVHVGVGDDELAEPTLRFAFEVVQPMIADFWGETIFDWIDNCVESANGETAGYLTEQLDRYGIAFVPPSG